MALKSSVITTHWSDPWGETVTSETGATHHGWLLGSQKVTSLNPPGVKNTCWISRTLSTGKNVEYRHRSVRHPRGPVPGPPRPHGYQTEPTALKRQSHTVHPNTMRLLGSERETPSTLQKSACAVTPGVTDVGQRSVSLRS